MATVTHIERETALLVAREPRNSFVFFMRETAVLGDLNTVTPMTSYREAAELNDNVAGNIIPTLRDTALLSSAAAPTVLRTRVEREAARLRSSAQYGVRLTHTARETAELNDVATGSALPVLRDTATLVSTAYPAVTMRRELREVAKLRGAVVVTAQFVVREVASLLDDFAAGVKAGGTLREIASLNDNCVSPLRVTVVERSTLYVPRNAVISPVGLFILHFTQLGREIAYLDSRMQATAGGGVNPTQEPAPDTSVPGAGTAPTPQPFGYGTAYTCSIATWGMSTFSNFPFKTMAGKLAAGDNLWRLDAADDYGVPIVSYIKTGIMDLGTSATKRLAAVYAAGYSDAPLSVSVSADVDGDLETYDYDLELRDQSNYRNNRALVGKGFRGRFVQFKIGGTASKYVLLTAEADVATSTRRL